MIALLYPDMEFDPIILELLTKQERRFIIQSMNHGVGVIDTNRCISYINDVGCEILGYPRNELIGKAII